MIRNASKWKQLDNKSLIIHFDVQSSLSNFTRCVYFDSPCELVKIHGTTRKNTNLLLIERKGRTRGPRGSTRIRRSEVRTKRATAIFPVRLKQARPVSKQFIT